MVSTKEIKRGRSIRHDLFLIIFLVAVLPLAIYLFFDFLSLSARIKRDTHRDFLETAENVKEEINVILLNRYKDLILLSENPILKSPKYTPEEKIAEMNKVQDYYKYFKDIILMDVSGSIILSTTYSFHSDLSKTSWFYEAAKGNGVITNPYKVLEGNKLNISFFVPVVFNEKIIYVLSAQMDMEKVWEMTDRVNIGKSGYIIILNKFGNILAHPNKDLIFEKFQGIDRLDDKSLIEETDFDKNFYFTDDSGEKYVGSFTILDEESKYLSNPLFILAVQPKKEAYSLSNYVIIRDLVQILVLASLIIIVSLYFSTRIIRPIETIIGGTKEITQGKMGATIDVKSWEEFNSIALAFNDMSTKLEKYTRELKSYEKELEDKVEEKTAELLKSEEKFRDFFETSRDVVFLSTLKGGFVEINKAAEELFGYSRSELLEMDIFDLYADKKIREIGLQLLNEIGFIQDLEVVYKSKDGILINCLITATLRKDKDGNIIGYQGIIRDITDKKKLEKQIMATQKMEAIGSLAGGIAHNFNNILVGIMGYSEYLSSKKGEDDPDYKALKTIHEATIRASELTRQLLNIARREEYRRQEVSLNDIIRRALSLVAGTFDKSIEIETHLSGDLSIIEGDMGQLEQCVLNLCINARDAMPEGGRLIVETFNQRLDENFIKTHVGVLVGDYIVLSISDNGRGISPEIKEHIFEPFFTTKEDKGGTGMGLSTVYGIVKNHGGLVTVYSEEGEGSTFKLYLPTVEGAIEAVTPVVERVGFGGDETILIIDDEPIVKDMLGDYLKDKGYQVFFAENGQEGIEIFSQSKDEIDLVVLDLIMPKLGGKEAFFRLKEIDPDVKVLFTSGYSENGQAYEILELSAEGFMQKPFPLREFAEKIREILDRKAERDS